MEPILVIDDDAGIREVLSKSLSHFGYQVYMAQNGEEGIELLKSKGDYKAVITDICMPVKNGNDVARYVKTSSRDNHIPVVGVSGSQEGVEKELFDYFLLKPFNVKDLWHLLKSF